MRRLLSLLLRLPRLLFIGLIRGYQLFISPHMPPTCRFQPTCSHYSIQAFRKYGALKGLVLTVYRLGRCHPWGGHGYDPPRWFGEPEEPSSAHDHTCDHAHRHAASDPATSNHAAGDPAAEDLTADDPSPKGSPPEGSPLKESPSEGSPPEGHDPEQRTSSSPTPRQHA